MGRLWNEIGRERYGVTDEKMLRFRYGVQVNSLGLTEAQPENNIQRIVLEALAVTLSRDARARAMQLPAWNEAMGLPRPWDQQWSLRIQQVLANETDLLEYPDIFEGSVVMDGLVEELIEGARAEMAVVEEHGGAVAAVPYMKARLVESHRERVGRIERGEQKVVGQNSFTESEDSPLTAGADGGILTPDPEVERERVEALEAWKAERDEDAVQAALDELGRGRRRRRPEHDAGDDRRRQGRARRPASGPKCCARRSAPTGARPASAAPRRPPIASSWPRSAAGSTRSPSRSATGSRSWSASPASTATPTAPSRSPCAPATPGMEVIYQGIRLTPEEIAESALQEDVDVVGLSILSGSHLELIPEVVRRLRDEGVDAPVVAGGIIPPPTPSACARPGSTASTRRRTSTSTRSWARSSSWSPTAPGRRRRLGAPRRPIPDGRAAKRAMTGTARPGCAATAAGRRTSRSRSTTTRSAGSTPRAAIPAEGIDEVQEAVVQCLDCMHDQPHLTFQDNRVVPIEDRWERMVAGTPWVASCTVTVDQDRVENCSGPEATEFLTYGAFGDAGVREFFTHVRFHKHDEEQIVDPHAGRALRPLGRRGDRGARGTPPTGPLEITSLAEESRPPPTPATRPTSYSTSPSAFGASPGFLRGTRTRRLNSATRTPSWLRTRVWTLTTPRSGFDFEGLTSSTSVSQKSVSPWKTGLGWLSSSVARLAIALPETSETDMPSASE